MDMRKLLLLCVLIMISGCATPIPLRVECPPPPQPPQNLMNAPNPGQYLIGHSETKSTPSK